MGSDDRKQTNQNNQAQETLDQFTDRFGDLSYRFDPSAFPALDRVNLPQAALPDRVKDQTAEAQQSEEQPHDIWPDAKAKPDFQDAAQNNERPEAQQGAGSQQVKDDAPEHNVKPPDNTESQDRQAHRERMAQDDRLSRVTMTDKYYERIAERLREAELDRRANGQKEHQNNNEQRQDYEQS